MKEMLRANARLLLLSVLILSNGVTAMALYHPEEGRWISRDPIGERGSQLLRVRGTSSKTPLNLYDFVLNSPLMGIDPLGEDVNLVPDIAVSPMPMGECGKADVTAAVKQMLFEIRSIYIDGGWDYCTKLSHCKALYTLPVARYAWDINPLAGIGLTGRWPFHPLADGSTIGDCGRTVVFEGKCYRAGDVNYAMWGQVNSLCNGTFAFNALHTLSGSRSLVFAWKSRYLWSQVGAAMDFTSYGYSGGGAPACFLPNCNTSGSAPVSGSDFQYIWNSMPSRGR